MTLAHFKVSIKIHQRLFIFILLKCYYNFSSVLLLNKARFHISLKMLNFGYGVTCKKHYCSICSSSPRLFFSLLQLQVSVRTSCQEIVSLVIQQLNKAVENRRIDAPLYPEEQWRDFGLVAIIAGTEHALSDNFCPLQLQNPWTQGYLCVQPKDNGLSVLHSGPSTAV